MHIETVGFIHLPRNKESELNEIIDDHGLFTFEAHESEIIVEADEILIKNLKLKDFITEKEESLLNQECDTIKFYM
tara:strand:+ start:83 stop:310 length:228 start_codon:yes stop_codon:yes gene_type:complete